MRDKRDRQGVRTPAQLEQKYSFGNDQKAVSEMRKLNAQFTRAVNEVREQMSDTAAKLAEVEAQIAALTQEFILVGIVNTEGVLSLNGTTYADLKALWDAGRCIVVYADQSDGTRRYYHCMGTAVQNAVTVLLFGYWNSASYEALFVSPDGSVTVAPTSSAT